MARAQSAMTDAAQAAEAQIEAQRREQKQATWDANWGRLRGMRGVGPVPVKSGKGPRLAPGERVILPGP